jgi:hypothetical protein
VVGYTQKRQTLRKKKNGKGKILKIFINSENLRGRRPVVGHPDGRTRVIANKKPPEGGLVKLSN